MSTKTKVRTIEHDGYTITQKLEWDKCENAYDIKTTIKPSGTHKPIKDNGMALNYRGFKSLAWIDVKKHKKFIDGEIDKAKYAVKQSKPSKSEQVYDELGFEDEKS